MASSKVNVDLDTQRSTWFSAVIYKPHGFNRTIQDLQEDLKKMFTTYCVEYFMIIHNRDLNELGKQEKDHIHCLIHTKDRKRFKTVINDISKTLDIASEAISNKFANDICGCARYLLHLDDYDKVQYPLKAVVSNDFSRYEELINFIDNNALSVDKIIKICYDSKDLLSVYSKIGLNNTRNYLGVINSIYHEIERDPKLHSKRILDTADNSITINRLIKE